MSGVVSVYYVWNGARGGFLWNTSLLLGFFGQNVF